ncbi:MmcQ/YjbR family DNA-binding protein [Aquimarina sp. TRL1]|uniref:MmcQ/YjbR family DNA-binding protein n=1 Tax=Aquimarina sp. (strain TRL1) TaxID=2736252 RepID=UPI00158B9184|nr:MmcQ/YjbR family DNA-binding protein [Aquimarina sp. TRL1]QKX04326.1 MmcQ/YjbR family DNA-binding protein [Aquimarina sp. TRL1]
MNIEEFRNYCLQKKGVTEEFPFDKTTLVFKVMGKAFALTGLDRLPFSVNLKCDPDRAIELRESHPQVAPGYHMNKKHWNTVTFSDGLPTHLLIDLIDHSYELVVNGLTKKAKEILKNL